MVKLIYPLLLTICLVLLQTLLPLKLLPDYKAYEHLYGANISEIGLQYYILHLFFSVAKSLGLDYNTFRLLSTGIFSFIFGKRVVELRNILVYIFAFIFVFEFVVIRYRAGLLFTSLLLISNGYKVLLYPLHLSTAFYQVLFAKLNEARHWILTFLISSVILISIGASSSYRIDFISELNPVRAMVMIVLPWLYSIITYKKNSKYIILFGLFSIAYYLNYFDSSGEVLVRVLGIFIFTDLLFLKKVNNINVYMFVMNSLFFVNTLLAV